MSCKIVKEFLSSKGFVFEDKDVSVDFEAMDEMIERTGATSTPVVMVNGEVVLGWERDKLTRLLGL